MRADAAHCVLRSLPPFLVLCCGVLSVDILVGRSPGSKKLGVLLWFALVLLWDQLTSNPDGVLRYATVFFRGSLERNPSSLL